MSHPRLHLGAVLTLALALLPLPAADLVGSIDAVSSGAAYTRTAAANGQTVYIDRTYALSGLPAGLSGATLIRTRNDDDGVTANPHLRFTLTAAADVQVAWSTAATATASWMGGWVDSGVTVSAGGGGSYRLYRKAFAGGQVALGGNERGTTGASSCYFVIVSPAAAGAAMPRFTGSDATLVSRHDGGQRWAVGVQEHALFRPTRNPAHTQNRDGTPGATFNHAMMLAFWRNRFWVSYHGSPSEGTEVPVPVYLCWSDDGRDWSKADVLFPAPRIGTVNAYSHQRNGFYRASDGRLLAFTFMGDRKPNDAVGGFARLVREIKGPGDYGPIWAVRYNQGYSAANTPWQPYASSTDSGLKSAIAEAVGDALWREDWNEEDPAKDLYLFPGTNGSAFEGKAFAWYRLPDQRVVGMWKGSWLTVSSGATWGAGQVLAPVQDHARFGNFYNTAKQWCERAENAGQYAMFLTMGVHRPATGMYAARSPLAVLTSADGLNFNERGIISGDNHPQWYPNPGTSSPRPHEDNKDGGPSYVRGLEAWDRRPSGDSLWVTYSVTKEPIYVAEVPTPVRYGVSTQVQDGFTDMAVGGRVTDWNIRDAGWCPVRVVEVAGNRRLRLADRDPYDYAKAFRVFPEMARPQVSFTIIPAQHTHGTCEVELVNHAGLRPVALKFDADGKLKRRHAAGWTDVAAYTANQSCRVVISLDLPQQRWSATFNGAAVATDAPLFQVAPTVERLELRTGAWRLDDWSRVKGYNDYPKDMLPGADDPVSEAVFDVDDVATTTLGNHTSWRIMPIGDSITVGQSPGGYRLPLQTLLKHAGYRYDFVGSQTPLNQPSGFDPDHEGYSGAKSDAIDAAVTPHLGTHQAAVYLVHVGTNDITAGEGGLLPARVRTLLDHLYAATPAARVLLARIIATRGEYAAPGSTRAQQTDAWNAAVTALVADYRGRGFAITAVDQHAALGASDFPVDDAFHPNEGGYAKMAQTWFAALSPLLVGEPGAPPVDATPPATPAAPLAAGITGQTVVLSGHSEPGAGISIRDHGVQIASATVDGGGAWSVSVTLAPGDHRLTVVAVDAAGNASAPSPALDLTVPAPAGGAPAPAAQDGGGSACGVGGGLAVLALAGVQVLLRLGFASAARPERRAAQSARPAPGDRCVGATGG